MAIAKAIIDEYQPRNEEDIQDAFKDIFEPVFEAMLQPALYQCKFNLMNSLKKQQRTCSFQFSIYL